MDDVECTAGAADAAVGRTCSEHPERIDRFAYRDAYRQNDVGGIAESDVEWVARVLPGAAWRFLHQRSAGRA